MSDEPDFKAFRRKVLIAIGLLAIVLVAAYLANEGQW